jgi:hypothetical protein
MTFYQGSLIYEVDSGKLRIGLRIYLTAIFLIISFVGNQCCRYRAMLRLLQQRSAEVPLFTGWLSGTSILQVWYKLGRPPASFMAYFMVLAALANFAGDVLVSGLVKTVQVPSRCQFGAGVVIPQKATDYISAPEYNQLAVRMAIQAQNTSVENGGLSGIYWKYNSESNFRAEAQDVAGNWICDDVHQDVTYLATETTIADDDRGWQAALQSIAQDLTAKGLLYPNSTVDVGTCVTIWGSAFFWGASPQPGGSGPWDVKASIDTDMIDQCVENRTLTLKSYQCSLDAPSLQWIINNTAAAQTIQQWLMGIYGALMDGPSAPANETLSSLLDVLTMVSHGGRVQTEDQAWGDLSIGCLADMAAIPAVVFTLLLLATIAGASMVAFWLTLFLSLRHTTFGLSLITLRPLKARTPNDLVDWMKFALWREGSLNWEEKRIGRCNLAVSGEYEVVFEDERQQGGNGLLEGKDMKRPVEVRETYAGFR